jgi:ribonuclease BN (tRNA processing enzyme)
MAPAPLESAAPRCAASAPTGAPLELVVLGSGGPRSFGRGSSAYVVLVDGVPRAMIDVGPGAAVAFGAMGLDFAQLDTYLLTHLHIDHAGDVPGVFKSRDLSFFQPLTFRVFGPSAREPYPSTSEFVDRLFGEQGAFRYLKTFRNELTLEVHDIDVDAQAAATPQVLLEDGPLRVLAIAVDHGDVPALAYRLEAHGQAVVISGDLASGDDHLSTLARGANLLVYDAAVLDPPAAPEQLYQLHTAPRRIGEVAAAAGVGQVVLSHLSVSVSDNAAAVKTSIAQHYAGPVQLAEDCQRFGLGR